jgi:hypothetical protein
MCLFYCMLTPLKTDISLRNPVHLTQPSNSLRDTCRFLNTPKKKIFYQYSRRYQYSSFHIRPRMSWNYHASLLRPLTTRAFLHTTSRHATPSLYCACLLTHYVTPSLYCACISENPFLTLLHSHVPLTSNAASNGSTRVASASLLNVFCTTNHDGRAPTYIVYIPFPNTHQFTNHHGSDIPNFFISWYVIGHVTLGWAYNLKLHVLLLSVLTLRTTAGGSTYPAQRHRRRRSTFPLPITTGAPYTLPTTNCHGPTLGTLTLYSATTNHPGGAPPLCTPHPHIPITTGALQIPFFGHPLILLLLTYLPTNKHHGGANNTHSLLDTPLTLPIYTAAPQIHSLDTPCLHTHLTNTPAVVDLPLSTICLGCRRAWRHPDKIH